MPITGKELAQMSMDEILALVPSHTTEKQREQQEDKYFREMSDLLEKYPIHKPGYSKKD